MLLLCVRGSRAQEGQFENTLMPQPTELRISGSPIAISPNLTTSLNGASSPLVKDAPTDAEQARSTDRCSARQESPADRRSHDRREGGGNQADRPALGVDESYSLDVQDGISSRFDLRSWSIATDLAT